MPGKSKLFSVLWVLVFFNRAMISNVKAELVLHLLDVRMVWDQSPHNAFTDLVRYKDAFYLIFREATDHVDARDGKIRILKSLQGINWATAAVFEKPGYDLRDPKVCIKPSSSGDLLMIYWWGHSNVVDSSKTFASFSIDGENWSSPRDVNDVWLWRITWHPDSGKGYEMTGSTMHITDDGLNFDFFLSLTEPDPSCPEYWPTEATIRFDNASDYAYILVRRNGEVSDTAILQISSGPPYTNWIWRDLGIRIGGPNFIQLPNNKWIAAIRDYYPSTHTELGELDVEQGRYTPLLELPSGGDTSYAGLFIHDDKIWVSYYSSHEGKAKIYIAELAWEQLIHSECTDRILRSEYHMDLPDTVADSGPAEENLNQTGSPSFITGFIGQAASLDATSNTQDGFMVQNSGLDLNSDGVIIDVMVRPDSDHQGNRYNNTIVGRGGHFNLFFITDNSGMPIELRWEVRGPSQVSHISYSGSVSQLLDGNWHHLIALYDPDSQSMELQVDEGQIDRATHVGAVGTAPNSTFFIGTATVSQTGAGFSGDIDELRVYTIGYGLKILTIDSNLNSQVLLNPQIGQYEYSGCSTIEISAPGRIVNCPDVYDFRYWQGDVANPDLTNTMVLMDDDKTVNAIYYISSACGDECHPILQGDLNEDCNVDFIDLSILISNWLD